MAKGKRKRNITQKQILAAQEAAHRTARGRIEPSAPMHFLYEKGLLKGRMLDYGAGRGTDADIYGMEKFDPKFFPKCPRGKYDTITSVYVLNVVPKELEGSILSDIWDFLKARGTAYIAVRRDIKKEGFTSKGTYQRTAYLDLPLLYEKKRNYAIYVMQK